MTLDAQPLDEAAILFVPLDSGRKKTGAGIVNGRFELPAEDGLLPGNYRVEIADNPPLDSVPHDRSTGPLRPVGAKRRMLPPGYSHNSPLRLEIPTGAAETPRKLIYDLQTRP